MKKIYTLLPFIFLFVLSHAQMPGPPQGAGNKGNFKMPNIARIYGKVLDAKTKEAVEFASVALLWFDKDSVIAGMLVKGNGDFSLENLPMGAFRLKISFIGYKSLEQKLFINPQKIEQDLGNILLEQDAAVLQEVTVSGEKSTVNMSIDRRVYNVDKDIAAKGGTALDVMKNVPGVTLDGDGNASLRNSAAQVYVDGRPTNLTLAQIPSDQIEKVEIITNPSVKFDASTSGGILNIVLKKNTKPGYNGMIMGGIGTSDRYTGMVNLNVKEGPLNFFVNYNYNTQKNITQGYTNRTNLKQGKPFTYYHQNNQTESKNTFQFARIGLDYNLNNRNTLTLAQNIMGGVFETIDLQKFDNVDAGFSTGFYGDRTNNQNSNFTNYTTQLLYKRSYPAQGKELTADLNYNTGASQFNNLFSTNNYSANANTSANPELQKNNGGTTSDMLTFQLDFVNPLSEVAKFETGIRSYTKESSSIIDMFVNYNGNDHFTKDSLQSNNYKITDMVNAAYANYSGKQWGIGYQAGLRFEQTYYKGRVVDKNQEFFYNYPGKMEDILKSLFPGLYLSKKFENSQEVQINFSRKINRPNFFQLMPFIMFADKQNIRIGNPRLAPEFINMAEANYNIIRGKLNFLSSFYYKYTENTITNLSYPLSTDSTILVNTFENAKYSYTQGFDNTIKYNLFNNFDITGNFNVFFTQITAGSIGFNSRNEGWSWFSKLSLSYKFPLEITLQVNGTYEAPKIIPQGQTVPIYFMDVSLNKMLMRKWIFNLTLSDAFNTKRLGSHYDTPFYVQDLTRRREARFLRFTVSYLFGKMDASIFKRKGTKRDGAPGNQDGLDF